LPFISIADLCRRVPELARDELQMLSLSGALAELRGGNGQKLHRREASWQVQKFAGWNHHPLLQGIIENDSYSPVSRMTPEDRLVADYEATGFTLGQHPMGYKRDVFRQMGIKTGIELTHLANGKWAIAGGQVTCRQRPGTAGGTMFLTLEDETGMANIIVSQDTVKEYWAAACNSPYLKIEGVVEKNGGVVHLLAKRIFPLTVSAAITPSHDFH
jgi:error-prone DNA polymerase